MTAHSSDIHAYFCTHQRDTACTEVAATAAPILAGDASDAIRVLDWPPSRGRPLVPDVSSRLSGSPSRSRPPRRTRSQRPSAGRHIILFLAADPRDTAQLALEQECAAIEHELRMTMGRDDFDFRSKWAVSVDEMMRHLNGCQPTIVHFSGHGNGNPGLLACDGQRQPDPRHRDVEVASASGIYLQDERRSQWVSDRALAQMIASAAPSTRVVVLNACFTAAVAETLRNVVDCIVGMDGAIGDDAARSFAVGFYRALGNRRSIGNAMAQAVATLAAKRLPDEHLPVCRTRDGVSANHLFLPSSHG